MQNLSNSQLRHTIEYGNSSDKTAAAEQLLKQLGITEPIDEKALIREIATQVLDRPGSLNMENWHCGTTHCLAGWATALHPVAAKIERETDTETAGCAAIPNYAHLFFSDNDTVIKILEEELK